MRTGSTHVGTAMTPYRAVAALFALSIALAVGGVPGGSAATAAPRVTAASAVGVTPTSGDKTTLFHGTGSGFTPSSTAKVVVDQPDGTAYPHSYSRSHAVDVSGDFTWTWQWASGDQLGTYTFVATDSGGSSAQTQFTITADTTGPPPTPEAGSSLMFDIASAPSIDNMTTWQENGAPYKAIGVYVPVAPGTDDRFDKTQANLTPAWVTQVQALGITVVPIYLGLQAPTACQPRDFNHLSASPPTARTQGLAAASYAASSVTNLGLSARVPVFYDMEQYATGCSAAVQAFFDGWTAGLHAAGRVSGVYGNQSSAMTDLTAERGIAGYHLPDDVWVATDDGSATTTEFTDPPPGDWTGHRANQFNLDLDRTFGPLLMKVDETAINNLALNSPVDLTAPTIALKQPAKVAVAPHVTFRWNGRDAGSGVGSYDLRKRTEVRGKAFGRWRQPGQFHALVTTAAALSIPVGADVCVQVRARDNAANVSGWSAAKCAARPVDDKSLKASSSWVRQHSHHDFKGSLLTTTTHGATLSLRKARVDRVGVVATTCSSCGEIGLYVGHHRIGVVSLHSSGTHHKQLKLRAAFRARKGTVTVKVLSSGKPVDIDGLVVSPT